MKTEADNSPPDPLTPILRSSMFWTLARQADSAWIEHTPFAFWLVDVLRPHSIVELGTFAGISYSAMCQAVKSLKLQTRCYAIDTWLGDEQAGYYSEEVFREFSAFHERHYGSFSRLVRSTFDEALSHFQDGSVNLLNIDGFHTYEAVRHDFESWLPKLSSNAVVLFHDTNVRESNFGVFRLWEEIKKDRHHFNFLHGHGLGVLGVGKTYPPVLRHLFQACTDDYLTASIRECFGSLGLSARLSNERRSEDRAMSRLTQELSESRLQCSANALQLDERTAEAARLKDEVAQADQAISALTQELSESRLQCSVNALQLDERTAEVARLKDEVAAQALEHQVAMETRLSVAAERFSAAAERLAKAVKAEQQAETRALKAENIAAESEMTLTCIRLELAAIRESTSWRFTAPFRAISNTLRYGLAIFGLHSSRIQRLRNVAGGDGFFLKRVGRVAFYLAAQGSVRLPASAAANRALVRWLPAPWAWLRNYKLRYLKMAEGRSVGVSQGVIASSPNARYLRWIVENEEGLTDGAKGPTRSHEQDVRVTILIEAQAGQLQALYQTIESLLQQSSPAWHCIIAVPAGSEFNKASFLDSRIVTMKSPSGQCRTTLADIVKLAENPFIAILGAGDRLSAVAIEEMTGKLRTNPNLDVVYSDEDRVAADGSRHTPSFKPGWSPELLQSYNYFGRLTVLRKGMVDQVGGFDAGLGNAAEWDLNLRISEASDRIDRITKVLCHRAADGASDRPGPKDVASASYREAIRRFWARQGNEAIIETLANGTQRAIWPLSDPPLVSIIVPNKDKPEAHLKRRGAAQPLERTVSR